MEVLLAAIVGFIVVARLLGFYRAIFILIIAIGAVTILAGVDLARFDLAGSLLAHSEFASKH